VCRITALQVLADYTSTRLNLADPAVFRDLSRPMGAQDAHQRELVAQAAKRRARPAAIYHRARPAATAIRTDSNAFD